MMSFHNSGDVTGHDVLIHTNDVKEAWKHELT